MNKTNNEFDQAQQENFDRTSEEGYGADAEELKEESKTETEEASEQDSCQSSEDSKEDEELQIRYLRLAADFQNYKKRVEKEKNDIYAFANEKLIIELLSVLDNFDRALSLDSGEAGLKEGMSMILKQLIGALEKNGLEEIKAKNEDFDPNFHHAVIMERSESHESGKVTEIMQKGYMLNKRVIRPAMVKVAE